ncbi:MAG: peptide-methionine (R)-S-oxide reductase [Flavobacteriales bacterium]|jgi:peptide-methionine (R)-S-oxide reductase
MTKDSKMSNDEWKKTLSEKEYEVLREKGTEAPFSGTYNVHFENGTYHCRGCNTPLFTDSSKFNSGCGWPAFDEPLRKGVVKEILDQSLGMTRVEIVCNNCDGHLGHVFNDGPTETGLRYCVNSVSLNFEKD